MPLYCRYPFQNGKATQFSHCALYCNLPARQVLQRVFFVGSGPAAARYFSAKVASAMLWRRESMNNVKQEVEQLLNKLPDDCSVEDIQYHLYVLDKVRRGLEEARLNGVLSQQEVEIRLSQWLTE
jgi:hypothetical protein